MPRSYVDVLCVDDDEVVLRSLSRLLKSHKLNCMTCSDPNQAVDLIFEHQFAVIISDMRMPSLNGAELLEKAQSLTPDTQRIILTGYADVETTMAAVNQGKIHGFIQKPWQNDLLLQSIISSIERYQLRMKNNQLQQQVNQQNKELRELNATLEQQVEKRTKQIRKVLKQLEQANEHEKNEHKSTVELLYNFINANPYLDGNKAQNIANTCSQIASTLKLPEKAIELAPLGGYLAQVGLLGMDPELYKTPFNRLSEQQRKTFYTHPSTAQLMLMPATHLHDVAEAIYYQFERYNGQGIPKGLAGKDIPLGAMMLSVARDYWDNYEQAPYSSDSEKHKHAIDNIKLYSGTHYHPKIAAALIACQSKIKEQKSTAGSVHICNAQELQEHNVLARALHSHAGIMLLPKGHVFTRKSIEKLQQLELRKPAPFRIMVK